MFYFPPSPYYIGIITYQVLILELVQKYTFIHDHPLGAIGFSLGTLNVGTLLYSSFLLQVQRHAFGG